MIGNSSGERNIERELDSSIRWQLFVGLFATLCTNCKPLDFLFFFFQAQKTKKKKKKKRKKKKTANGELRSGD
jgi:hypothetical protein